jgi:hypothetical protein
MNPETIRKAIVAVVGAAFTLLEVFDVIQIEDHEKLITTISSILTPVLVYYVPNRKPS